MRELHAGRPHHRARTLFKEQRGYRVIRFGNIEVYEQIDRMCDAILVALGNR